MNCGEPSPRTVAVLNDYDIRVAKPRVSSAGSERARQVRRGIQYDPAAPV